MGVEIGERLVEVDVEVWPSEVLLSRSQRVIAASEHDPLVRVHVVVDVGGGEQHPGVAGEPRPVEDLGRDGGDLGWPGLGGLGDVDEPVGRLLKVMVPPSGSGDRRRRGGDARGWRGPSKGRVRGPGGLCAPSC